MTYREKLKRVLAGGEFIYEPLQARYKLDGSTWMRSYPGCEWECMEHPPNIELEDFIPFDLPETSYLYEIDGRWCESTRRPYNPAQIRNILRITRRGQVRTSKVVDPDKAFDREVEG
jgi:hypothetical protein